MPIFDHNRELLDRFRRGERAALAEVYERYVDEVATLARRGFTLEAAGLQIRGVGLEDEHEVVQDTFVRAFGDAARAAFDGIRPYGPFLLRITRNLMIDRHRASRHAGAPLPAGNVDELLGAAARSVRASSPEDDLHWRSLSEATAAYVATLDAESREIVRLRFESDLSQDSVAAQLGCSRRRVRTVERRVRTQLARHLKRLRPARARRERRFFDRLLPVFRRRRVS